MGSTDLAKRVAAREAVDKEIIPLLSPEVNNLIATTLLFATVFNLVMVFVSN
jgi:hypothetical protein